MVDSSCDCPYGYNGKFNTGISTVNINSNRDELINAYPWKADILSKLPFEYRLRFNSNVYYKK